jgi:hypothetical protein
MKQTERLMKLADKFEQKLQKYANEVASEMITLTIRPVINGVIVSQGVQQQLVKIFNKAAEADAKKNVELSGYLQVGEQFITNAQKTGGKWAINRETTKIHTEGDLIEHPIVKPLWNQMMTSFYSAVYPAMEAALNKVQLEGDTVTNHEVNVNRSMVQS